MSEETSKPHPLYTQVRDQILQRITQGVYQPGRPIPSESNIADEFGVSVFTVRQAVALLVADDVLIKQQGRRTYVADRRTRLTLFTWLASSRHGQRLLDELIAMVEAAYPALSVECIPTTYPTAKRDLLHRISTGDAPDVAHITSHWTSFFAYMGAFEKLEGLLSSDNLEERFYDKDLWGGLYRNRLYSVAWGLCPMALVANRRVLRQAGITRIPNPLTFDEFTRICREIENVSPRNSVYSYGLSLAGDETDFLRMYPFLQAFNGGLADTQGTVQLNSPENVAAFGWLKQFLRQRHVLFANIQTLRERFAEGDVAFMTDGPWIAPLISDLTGKPFADNFDVSLNPAPGGSTSSSWTYNHALAICSQSPRKVQAAALVDALTNDTEISRHYYARVGHLPVHQRVLDQPGALLPFQEVYKQQLLTSRCINAQNRMFEKAMDFCVDAMKNILFEGADIQQELDQKEYILNMLYAG